MKSQKPQKTRNRKDHWLPQGYLRGFIGPSRTAKEQPLFYFEKSTGEWRDVSPKEIGWGDGFYDYAKAGNNAISSDEVFARPEREFPMLRQQLIQNHFVGWEHHKSELLSYMQMIRARSPLAMSQWEEQARGMRARTIDSADFQPMDDEFVRDFQIVNMLKDVQAGPTWMTDFDWCLRYTDDENNSYCATDQALLLIGSEPAGTPVSDVLVHRDTRIVFPLCWQAALIGRKRKYDGEGLGCATLDSIREIRHEQKLQATEFVVSPAPF